MNLHDDLDFDLNDDTRPQDAPDYDREIALIAQDDNDSLHVFPNMGKTMSIAELLLKGHNKEKLAKYMGMHIEEIDSIGKSWVIRPNSDDAINSDDFAKLTEHREEILQKSAATIGLKRMAYVQQGGGKIGLNEPYFKDLAKETNAYVVVSELIVLLYIVMKEDIYSVAENLNLPVSVAHKQIHAVLQLLGISMEIAAYLRAHKHSYDSLVLIKKGRNAYGESLRSLYIVRRAQEIINETSSLADPLPYRLAIAEKILGTLPKETIWDKVRVFCIPKFNWIRKQIRKLYA